MYQNILKSSLCTFNCYFIISGITMRKAKVKVFDVQLQKGENKLQIRPKEKIDIYKWFPQNFY